MAHRAFLFAALALLVCRAPDLWAATCTTSVNGNWTAQTWTCGHSPTTGDSVVIAHNVTLNTSPSVDTITINANRTLTFDDNTRTLTLGASGGAAPLMTVNGTFAAGTNANPALWNSKVSVQRNAALNPVVTGTAAFYDLEYKPTIGAARTWVVGSGVSVLHNWDIINSCGGTQVLTVNLSAAMVVGGTTTVKASGSCGALLDTTGSNFTFTTDYLSVGVGAASSTNTFRARASTVHLTGDGSLGALFSIDTNGTFTSNTSTVSFEPATAANGTVTLTSKAFLASGGDGFRNFTFAPVNTGVTGKIGATSGPEDIDIAGNLAVTAPGGCPNPPTVTNCGTLDDNGNQITGNGTGTLTLDPGTTLSLGSGANNTTFPATFTAAHITLDVASTVIYKSTGAQTVSGTPTYGNLIINKSGATGTLGAATTVAGDLTISAGTLDVSNASNFALAVKGDFTNNATFQARAGRVTFSGTAVQTIGGSADATFFNVTTSNAVGVSISRDETITGSAAGALTLTGSVITTGANQLILTGNCTVATITRTTGHITGNLQLTFPNGASTCTYPLGDTNGATPATDYSPATIAFTAGLTGGRLTGSVTQADYSDTNIPVNPNANVTRYWTFSLPGGSTLTTTGSYGPTFTYLSGSPVDNDSTGNVSSYVIARGTSCSPNCTWTLPTMSGIPTTTSAAATAIAGANFGIFVVGRRPSGSTSTVVASPTVVPADNSSTSTITVTLKDPAGNLLSGKTVTLAAGSGSSTITGSPATTNGSGVATFTVKDATIETVVYTATSEGVVIAQTATVEFAPASFNAFETSTGATAITGQLFTKLAGANFTFDVVAVNAGAKASTFNNAVQVDLVTGSTGGQNCPGGTVTPVSSAQSVTLASGRATIGTAMNITSAYRDVRVRIQYPTGLSPIITTCSLDNFSIRPASFTITSVPTGPPLNVPGATNTGTSGIPAIKTGAVFNLTATTTQGYDGTPGVDTTQVTGTPTAGTLSGTFLQASTSGGVATAVGNAFTYSEVGNFGLNANAVTDTTFTSVDQAADCINTGANQFSTSLVGGQYGCKIGSAAVTQTTGSSGFGRFIPDHFHFTAVGTVSQACASGAFSYMGQSATFSTITLVAQNSGNTTTQNYAGSYEKLDGSSGSFGFAAHDTGGSGTNIASGRIGSSGISASWSSGTLTLGATISIARATSPDGPYDATQIAIAPTDADGVTMVNTDFNVDTDGTPGNDHVQIGTSTKWRFGRLRLQGASGPTNLRLPIPISTEYWQSSSNAFTTNTLDGCTTLQTSDIGLGPYTAPLASGDTSVTSDAPPTISFSAGIGRMYLTAPSSSTHTGSVVVTANLGAAAKSYLQGAWNGVTTYDQDPKARAAFGVYGAQPRSFIFQRENY